MSTYANTPPLWLSLIKPRLVRPIHNIPRSTIAGDIVYVSLSLVELSTCPYNIRLFKLLFTWLRHYIATTYFCIFLSDFGY
nr:MAG TPA: hypothetical protein [Caudoviricetes sp.]